MREPGRCAASYTGNIIVANGRASLANGQNRLSVRFVVA